MKKYLLTFQDETEGVVNILSLPVYPVILKGDATEQYHPREIISNLVSSGKVESVDYENEFRLYAPYLRIYFRGFDELFDVSNLNRNSIVKLKLVD